MYKEFWIRKFDWREWHYFPSGSKKSACLSVGRPDQGVCYKPPNQFPFREPTCEECKDRWREEWTPKEWEK